ncbi:MAG: FAD-dependent oxidoreductase [Phycisphaerae bacterium]
MLTITEPARDVPVVAEVDVCVLGGSCTGVFASVAAARAGASAAVVEVNGCFGGVATAGLVNIWHKTVDERMEQQIIGGLTMEVVDRLRKRDAVKEFVPDASKQFILNTAELQIELDELVRDAGVRPFLHTRFVAPVTEDGQVTAAIIEDKTGRRAIKAKQFIDATGDGDLLARAGLPFELRDDLQPPTVCAMIQGIDQIDSERHWVDEVFDESRPEHLTCGFLWTSKVTGLENMRMVAGSRVNNANCADADELTAAEIEGRRQVRVICDVLRSLPGGKQHVGLAGMSSYIGIRETRHAVCLHRVTEEEVLHGVSYPDTIGNGCYRVDVHHSDKPGLTFRYLDGREEYLAPGEPKQLGRWREETDDWNAFYQIPYRSLVPKGSKNVLVAGRLLDADRGAYGGLRVMVNCNQTGQAAGLAAAQAAKDDLTVDRVDTSRLQQELRDQGAVIF